MKNINDHFELLRTLDKNPSFSQRKLAEVLGFSLGKLNYCLNELKKKGFIKINTFAQNQNKVNYIYILTPKGIVEKTKLTLEFVKRKMKEYDDIKKEASKIYKKRKNI